MFKKLFQKKQKAEINSSDKLSKIEYWNKWQLFELFDHLHNAEKLLNQIAIDKTETNFIKFKTDFIEHLYEIKGDNVADFTTIWEWFTPTKDWDFMTGQTGKELGNKIFHITDKWKRNQDFIVGTKVSLDNDYGVVLDKTEHWNVYDDYGIIRWDTDKEIDNEDWRGLFGSFLQAGGQIIN